LLDLGVTRNEVQHALRSGRLRPVHRGVYAVGHTALSQEARWMAAVLAGGPGAVLSHRSAASLWRLIPRPPALTEISTLTNRRSVEGIAIHRPRALADNEVTRHRGIPTTTVTRTLVDLADEATDDELQRALHSAEILYSVALDGVRTEGRRAATRLKGPRDRSRSELEREFKRLCARAGIEAPRNNARVAGLEVDFVWPEERAVVELDGWRFHRSRHQFELDRRRDAKLARAGYRVVRFTYRQVTGAPHEVVATLRAALASAA
jgi:very-short-patch-repair endonuclease